MNPTKQLQLPRAAEEIAFTNEELDFMIAQCELKKEALYKSINDEIDRQDALIEKLKRRKK